MRRGYILALLCLLIVWAGSVDASDLVLERIEVSDDGVTHEAQCPFDEQYLRAEVDLILADWRAKGYPLANLEIDSLQRNEQNVVVFGRVIEGPQVVVGEVRVEGLTRTREELLQRYLRVRSGDTLRSASLEESEVAAEEIGFVTYRPSVGISYRPGYDKADLVYRFEELPQVEFAGGIGYVPDQEGGAVWSLDVKFNSLFGGGRTVGVVSSRPNQDRTHLRVDYTQPVFIGGPGEFTLAVATRDYRNDFYEFKGTLGLRTYVSLQEQLGVSLNARRVEPNDDDGIGYASFGVGTAFISNRTSPKYNPRSGWGINAELEYQWRRADSSEIRSFSETRAQLKLDWYLPVVGDWVQRFGLTYLGFETPDDAPPVSELFFVGGPGTMRGFRTQQFLVQRAGFGTIEPRLRFESSVLFGFVDLGYLQIIETGFEIDEAFKWSGGIGFSLVNARRGFTISLAWAEGAAVDEPYLSVDLQTGL